MERHRQAQRGLGALRGCARGHARLSAQPPHPRVVAAQGRRVTLVQFRSHHRTGGVVRPAGEDREIRRPGRGATRLRPDQIPGGSRPRSPRMEGWRMSGKTLTLLAILAFVVFGVGSFIWFIATWDKAREEPVSTRPNILEERPA